VSQTIDYKRGVNGIMLSSRLLNDVFVSRVSQNTTIIFSDLTHTGHVHIS
jgi:hypothetical protein